MPLSTSDVLDAYRADLSNAGKSQFSDRDSTWLAFGTLLQRAVSLPVEQRARYLQSASGAVGDLATPGALAEALTELSRDGSSTGALCTVVMTLAADAEDVGAFALATAMLDFARILVGLAEFRLQGRLLAHQARILRKIGETELSHELFDQVALIGETHGDRELLARAHLGKGVLARIRGNYPEARAAFSAVLEQTGDSEALRELHVHAHHGLLIVSTMARDFNAALTHGAAAVAGAVGEQHRLEMLLNLASVCYEAGHLRSALNGYLRVLAGCQVDRLRLASFGGAAAAAARLGDGRTVDELAKAAAPLMAQRGPTFELADMAREFAEAYAYLGNADRWREYRDDALTRAERGKFFEIVHRIESMQAPQPAGPAAPAPRPDVALTRDALAVTADLALGDSGELLAAAVSSGH